MPTVEEAIEIQRSAADIFPIVENVEGFPDFMEGVKKVTFLERGDDWTISEWITEAAGRNIKWIEKDYPKPEENRIDFELVKGDLKSFSGFWQLEANGEATRVVFNISFEFGIPMLAPLLHPVLAKILRENMKQMLESLKNNMEKQAVPI